MSSVPSVPDVVTVYILAFKPINHWFLLFLFYTLCTWSRKGMSPTRKTLQTFDTHSPLNTRKYLRGGWPSDVSWSTEFNDVLAIVAFIGAVRHQTHPSCHHVSFPSPLGHNCCLALNRALWWNQHLSTIFDQTATGAMKSWALSYRSDPIRSCCS